MGDSRFSTGAEITSSQVPTRPLSPDQAPSDPLTTDSIENTSSFVCSLESGINAAPCCRASPPVVGRTTSMTLTTSALDYASLVTSPTGMEPVDSGFSSWTVTAEPNPHFSPTLLRLDSEGNQAPDESQVSCYTDKRPGMSEAAGLCELSCGNAFDEELCDRMLFTHLLDPSSSCVLDRPAANAPSSGSWLADDNNEADPHSQGSFIQTCTTSEPWRQLDLTEGSPLFYGEPAQSPFRPVRFLEDNSAESRNTCEMQRDILTNPICGMPFENSIVSANLTERPSSECVRNSSATLSAIACACREFCNRHRPGSAPLHFVHGSAHPSSIDFTDNEPTTDLDGASIDTANDGDDEEDTNTPNLRVRRRKLQRPWSSRHSHPGLHCCSSPTPPQVAGTFGATAGIQSHPVLNHINLTNSNYMPNLSQMTSRTGIRTDPLWRRRRQLAPMQMLDMGRSRGPRYSLQRQTMLDIEQSAGDLPSALPCHNPCSVLGTTDSPPTVPPMPDVVPRENRSRLRSLNDGSISPSSSTLFLPFPAAAPLYRSPLQRIDSIRDPHTPRCASVPIGSVESPGLCAAPANYQQYIVPAANTDRCPVQCCLTRHHQSPFGGISQVASGALTGDSLPGGHEQLSMFARRMAHIGDELVAQRRLGTRTRYSLPTESFLNGVRNAAHTAHSLWSLSSSLASLMTAPLDYMHRIVQLAGQSLSGTSTQATNSPVPRYLPGSHHGRRRAQTYAGGSVLPRVGHTHPREAVTTYDCAPNVSPVQWLVRTSTPAHGRSRQPPLASDSSSVYQNSPIDEARACEYIFHFENE